jgi:hypothetical protein
MHVHHRRGGRRQGQRQEQGRGRQHGQGQGQGQGRGSGGEEHLLGEPAGDAFPKLVLQMPFLVQSAHERPSCRLLRRDHSLKWVMDNVSVYTIALFKCGGRVSGLCMARRYV